MRAAIARPTSASAVTDGPGRSWPSTLNSFRSRPRHRPAPPIGEDRPTRPADPIRARHRFRHLCTASAPKPAGQAQHAPPDTSPNDQSYVATSNSSPAQTPETMQPKITNSTTSNGLKFNLRGQVQRLKLFPGAFDVFRSKEAFLSGCPLLDLLPSFCCISGHVM